jgi:hypothetical protein
MELQREVMNFARNLAVSGQAARVTGRDLVRFSGAIDPSDAARMSQAIELGCEQIASAP